MKNILGIIMIILGVLFLLSASYFNSIILYQSIIIISAIILLAGIITSFINKDKITGFLGIFVILSAALLMMHGISSVVPHSEDSITESSYTNNLTGPEITKKTPLNASLIPPAWVHINDDLYLSAVLLLEGVERGEYDYEARLVKGEELLCIQNGSRVLLDAYSDTFTIQMELPCNDRSNGVLEVKVGIVNPLYASIEVNE